MASFPASRGSESNFFTVIITSNRLKQSIKASMPESWEETITSNWSPFLSSGAMGTAGKVIEQGLRLKGYSFKTKELSRLVWDNNEPLKLTMPLEFISYTNARQEVEEPIENLKKIASPIEKKTPGSDAKSILNSKILGKAIRGIAKNITFLNPPGPGIVKGNLGKNTGDQINIYIGANDATARTGQGQYFRHYRNVVITSVQAKWWRDFTPQGYCHRGTALVAFQTMDVWTWNDINRARSTF